jgi:hypothetical protein
MKREGTFSIALLAMAIAAAIQLAPTSADAMDRTVERYAQNNAIRTSPSARNSPQIQGPPHAYLLRGFMNVFSLGMDDLAVRLQAEGISAVVTNHADADLLTSQIMSTYSADHGPIILIGHSLGADAVVDVADALSRYNIPVGLLVLFDGTAPHQIPPNVVTAINYTKHFMINPAPGSRGAVSNVDLSNDGSVDHLSIDKTPSFQSQVLNYALRVASPAPAPRRQ